MLFQNIKIVISFVENKFWKWDTFCSGLNDLLAKGITLRHMRIMMSQITGNLAIYTTACLPVNSPHKGSIMHIFDVFFVVSLNKLLKKIVELLVMIDTP